MQKYRSAHEIGLLQASGQLPPDRPSGLQAKPTTIRPVIPAANEPVEPATTLSHSAVPREQPVSCFPLRWISKLVVFSNIQFFIITDNACNFLLPLRYKMVDGKKWLARKLPDQVIITLATQISYRLAAVLYINRLHIYFKDYTLFSFVNIFVIVVGILTSQLLMLWGILSLQCWNLKFSSINNFTNFHLSFICLWYLLIFHHNAHH